jgi:hypothetical protein
VLSRAQQETESKTMSVALAQPHRRGLPSCQRANTPGSSSASSESSFAPIIATATIAARARLSGRPAAGFLAGAPRGYLLLSQIIAAPSGAQGAVVAEATRGRFRAG